MPLLAPLLLLLFLAHIQLAVCVCEDETCSNESTLVSPKCAAVLVTAGGALGGLLLPNALSLLLDATGFSKQGIRKKSMASFVHSKIGKIVKNSIYSQLQSQQASNDIYTPPIVVTSIIAGGYFGVKYLQFYCEAIDSVDPDSSLGQVFTQLEIMAKEYFALQADINREFNDEDGPRVGAVAAEILRKIVQFILLVRKLLAQIIQLLLESGNDTLASIFASTTDLKIADFIPHEWMNYFANINMNSFMDTYYTTFNTSYFAAKDAFIGLSETLQQYVNNFASTSTPTSTPSPSSDPILTPKEDPMEIFEKFTESLDTVINSSTINSFSDFFSIAGKSLNDHFNTTSVIEFLNVSNVSATIKNETKNVLKEILKWLD